MTTVQQVRWWGVALLVFCLLLWLLSSVLLPFVAGMAVAYFFDPVADRLEKVMSRTLATTIVLVLFLLLVVAFLLLMVPLIQSQVAAFASRLPEYTVLLRDNVLPFADQLLGRMGVNLESDLQAAASGIARDVVLFIGEVFKQAWSGGVAFFNLLSLVVITPIVAFYLLRDWDRMVEVVDGWLPRQHAETIRELIVEIDSVLAGFVRGQGTVCLLLGAFYAVCLTLAGLDFGALIGIIAGLISFIPFVGSIIGLLLSLIPAFTQFWPDLLHIGIIVAIFATGQFLEGNFLSPRILGDRIGLHPVWIMFALLAGGALFGLLGILLAVPAAAAAGVLVRFAARQYLSSRIYLGPGGGAGS